jgi:broad specificity phosphatase PhoE
VIICEDLKEMVHGKYLGKSIDEIDWTKLPCGMEGRASMRKRARRFLNRVAKKKYECLIVVSHNAMNKAIIRELIALPKDDNFNFKQENTCVNVLEISKKGHKIHLLNCTKHLDEK